MSATNRDEEVGKTDGAKVPNEKREIEDIDPDQDPTRPAAKRPEVAEGTPGQAKEESNTQKPAPGAQPKKGGTFGTRDIDVDQDPTGAA